MTSKMTSTVRLVRCPKCRKVLPEPPEVLIYECGGCGTKLQAKKRNNLVDDTSQKLKDDSSGKLKMEQVSDDQEAGSSSNRELAINSIDKPEQNSDQNNLDSSNKDENAGKKVENVAFDGPSGQVKEYSAIQMKMKQLSDDEKVLSSTDRLYDQNDPRSSTELSGHDQDPESSPEAIVHKRTDQKQDETQDQRDEKEDYYPNAEKKQENVTSDASSVGFEHSAEKQKMDKLSDDRETYSRFNQLLLVNSINEESHNSFEDLETSPEGTFRNRIDQDLNDEEFLSCRKGTDFEESSSEFEEASANTKIVRDSDGGSKSSFKSMIAEKLLDSRQKKAVYLDEDDILSEDGSADLHHRRRFDRISSVETLENPRFGGTGYYGYEGSESSFDGSETNIPRKNRVNRRNEFHPSSVRSGKNQHYSTDVRSLYGSNEFRINPRHRSPMIPENPKMERIELLKMVQELQDQLERTNVSNVAPRVPSYYNHILNNQGRYGPRMAFSGEQMAVNGRRDGNLCHQCGPQDRRFSAQLPRQHVCSNGPHYGPNSYYNPQFSGPSSPKLLSESNVPHYLPNTYYNPQFSGPSSPKLLSESNVPHYGPNTYYNPQFSGPSSPKLLSASEFSASDDHLYRKPYRSPMKKRYVRPISGGSPWITCYRCSEVLQLPQSFLVFKRKCHSLKCGACFKVLTFTLSNRTHVSRYYPEETIAAPPSSEVEDYDKPVRSRADPVSCSDRSFQKSSSTETDRNGSWEFSEEKRKATMLRDTSDSTRPSSSKASGRRKARSEIEEVEDGPNGSRLHWLMGYPSPSKVIRG